ncbi:MAG: hypothetical protein ACLP53_31755 [Isosphaeraceae bacterium]
MLRSMLRGVMLFTLLTLPPAVLAGSTTYNILNYPDLQGGWTVSGTITTDGFIGDLNENDIESWTWTITSGATTWTAKSGPGVFKDITQGLAEIQTTPTELLLNFSNGSDALMFGSFSAGDTMTNGILFISPRGYGIDYNAEQESPISVGNRTYEDIEWTSAWQPILTIPQAPQYAWLLAQKSAAAVPEPASLYLVGFGAVCGSVYVMGHKRRARRTATTAA